jgi:hypothetical protein
MSLRLWVTRICPLVQQHEASTSGQKMGVARLLRHFSTRVSLPSHPELHTIVSGRDLGTSVPTLSASRMEGLFIEDPDTCDGVSRAHAPSRSHRLPEQWVHGEKELAELPNQAKQRQLPFDRIQMLE